MTPLLLQSLSRPSRVALSIFFFLDFFTLGWEPLGRNGLILPKNYKRLPPSITLLPVSSLFITDPPLPLFSLCGLCDAELTCRFGGNATLLSCDVKVATRRPRCSHATVGRDGRGSGKGKLQPLGWALGCRLVGANEPLRDIQQATRSGEGSVAEETTGGTGCSLGEGSLTCTQSFQNPELLRYRK